MVEKETWKTGLIVFLTIVVIVLTALILMGVFNTTDSPSSSSGLSSSQDFSDFYEGTVQCRAKFPNSPLAFGKKGKGCYVCPENHIGFAGDLDLEGEPKCYPVSFRPALSMGKYLSCQGYNTETRTALPTKDQLNPSSDVHYPNVCELIPRNRNQSGIYFNATRLGDV